MADEKIIVAYKPLGGGVHHKYALYLGPSGEVKGYARLGSSKVATADFYGEAYSDTGLCIHGKLYGAFGTVDPVSGILEGWNPENPDFDDNLGGPGAHENFTSAEQPDLSAEWDAFTAKIAEIDSWGLAYSHLFNNCNSGMDTALSGVSTAQYPDGLVLPTNDDLFENYAPGSGNILSDSAYECERVRINLDRIIEKITDGRNNASPLVFDLNNSGTIDLISLANSNVFWDFDLDGFREASGWVDSVDGLLALDVNSNGRIDNNSELFGTMDTDGFTILSQYDSNSDGYITAEDTIWEDLIIWQDLDENGFSAEGELYSLSDFDIVSIDLNATEVNQTNQGHDVTHTSSFTVDDGVSAPSVRIIHDVWFEYENVNSLFIHDALLDEYVSLLPTLRGFGALPDMHIVTSLDQVGTGNLADLLSDFAVSYTSEIFTDDLTILDEVRDILYRWAGVDGLSGNERGEYVDSRELGFLEKLMGQNFLQRGAWSNPYYWAGQDLQEAFHMALNYFYARLVAQVAGGELFEGSWHYDLATDSFVGVTGLNLTVLDGLETEATGSGDPETFWQNVIRMIEYSIGVSSLDASDQTALDDAIYASNNSLSLTGILDTLEWAGVAGSTVNGTSGDDTLSGGSGNDDIAGGNGNDTINSGGGADIVDAGAGNDTIDGGAGADLANGNLGNDTYIYELTDGIDTYEEHGNSASVDTADVISFGAGIDSGDVTFVRAVNSTDLIINIDTGSQTGQIVIENQFNWAAGGGLIETILFSDTSTINLATRNYTLTGTDGADDLDGVRWGGGITDTIYGNGGNDNIYGYDGADTLYGGDGHDHIEGGDDNDTVYGDAGNDTLEGNAGNDHLYDGTGDDEASGGTGDDVYHYGGGHDTYIESSGTDSIVLASGIASASTVYYRIGPVRVAVVDCLRGRVAPRATIYTAERRDAVNRKASHQTTKPLAMNDNHRVQLNRFAA